MVQFFTDIKISKSEIEEKFLKASHAVDNFRSIEVRPIFFSNLNQFDFGCINE